jgi:hypothetical protein
MLNTMRTFHIMKISCVENEQIRVQPVVHDILWVFLCGFTLP